MARAAGEAARAAREAADLRSSHAESRAAEAVNRFRADYPGRLSFAYRLDKKAREWPFLVDAMWHDGQFTYLRSRAQESPAIYELKDGKPSLVAYDLSHPRASTSPATSWVTAGFGSERNAPDGASTLPEISP